MGSLHRGKDQKKEKLKKKKTYILDAIKRLENTDEEKYISRAMHCRGERKVERMEKQKQD